MKRTDFTERAVGFCLYCIISYLPLFFTMVIVLISFVNITNPEAMNVQGGGIVFLGLAFWGILPCSSYILNEGSIAHMMVILQITAIPIVLNSLLSTIIEYKNPKNRSLGHRIIQSQVTFVRPQSKARSLLTLLLRNVLKFTFWYLFPFLLLPIFTKEHLPLHDVLSGTRVVKLSDT